MVCQRHGIFFFSGVSEFLSWCLVYADPSMAGGCMSFSLSLSLSLSLSRSIIPGTGVGTQNRGILEIGP